jgi:hypothetical protein
MVAMGTTSMASAFVVRWPKMAVAVVMAVAMVDGMVGGTGVASVGATTTAGAGARRAAGVGPSGG